MKTLEIVLKILFSIFIAGVIFACNVFDKTSKIPGVTYVTSRGNPRADSIVWSPKDINKILVNTVGLVQHNSQVYILDVITKKKTMLVDTDYGVVSGTWSSDGTQVVLLVEGGTKGFSQGGLWLVNIEDNSLKLFSDRAGVVNWLPDGGKLALLTKDSASGQHPRQVSVYLIDVQTKETTLIYSNQEAVSYSGFSSSPDGNHLVFSLNLDYYSTTSDLYVLDLRTGSTNQLSHDGASGDPRWSPSGDLIVYVKSNKVENRILHSLHVTTPDGSCDLKVPNGENAFSPTWSPDGKKIAFIGEESVYILDIDTVFGKDIYQDSC